MDGLIGGISGKLAQLRDTVVGVADAAAGWFKEKLGINSPSRVFMEFGGWMSEGAAIGMQKGQKLASTAALALAAASTAPMAQAALSVPQLSVGSALTATGGTALTRPAAPSASSAGFAVAAGPTTINIYPPPGADSKDIARAVRDELDRRERNQQSRRQSALSDNE